MKMKYESVAEALHALKKAIGNQSAMSLLKSTTTACKLDKVPILETFSYVVERELRKLERRPTIFDPPPTMPRPKLEPIEMPKPVDQRMLERVRKWGQQIEAWKRGHDIHDIEIIKELYRKYA